jgi:hypothetical protein
MSSGATSQRRRNPDGIVQRPDDFEVPDVVMESALLVDEWMRVDRRVSPKARTREEKPGTFPAMLRLPSAAPLAILLALPTISGCAGRDAEPPNPTRRLHAVLPSTAVVGEPVDLFVAPLTDLGIPSLDWTGRLRIEATDPELATPSPFRGDGQGALVMPGVAFGTPGVHRVTVTSDSGDVAIAGPVRVVRSAEELRPRQGEAPLRIFWGDAHGHSDVGDGVHPPRQYFHYARDIARLDFTCLSEHDYQQFLEVGLDETPAGWDSIAAASREWRRPGFAVLLGWEWSSRAHGHRVVLFPADGERYVSFQQASTPADLAEALRGTGAFSIVAHPSGSELTPVVDWQTIVPGFDRAIEVYSGHGAMDGDRAFRPTSAPRPGASAIDAIRRGLRFGIVAFSDTHLSTPGNPWPPPIRDAPWRGGLTAVCAPAATEADVFAALRDGRTYATSGERFLVEFRAGDRTMGETLAVEKGRGIRVTGLAAGSGAWRRIEIMAGERVLEPVAAGGATVELSREVGPFDGDTALWLRGESEAGERFWTTPVWVVPG